MDIKLGYQIYSAREEAEKDFDAVCAKLKEFGYDGVEFAGFYGYSAEDIIAVLKKYDLAAVSSHVPYDSIIADMDGTIAFHKAIGCKFIAVPLDDPCAGHVGITARRCLRNEERLLDRRCDIIYPGYDHFFHWRGSVCRVYGVSDRREEFWRRYSEHPRRLCCGGCLYPTLHGR